METLTRLAEKPENSLRNLDHATVSESPGNYQKSHKTSFKIPTKYFENPLCYRESTVAAFAIFFCHVHHF